MRVRVLAVCCALLLGVTASSVLAASGADFPVADGWFYSEANGQGGGPGQPGYTITNDAGITFYAVFQRGGVALFGYPASPRLTFGGFTDQILQKSVFQWAGDHVNYLNVMDVLHAAGKDPWLQATYQTPPPEDTSPDTGLTFAQVTARHLAFLDSNQALKAAYFAVADPIALYGLPLTHPTSELGGQVIVVRCQRAVLQQWTISVPWAQAGQVTVANGGDILKASGLIPAAALAPQPAPNSAPPASVAAVMLTTADLPSGFVLNTAASRPIPNGQLQVFVRNNPIADMSGPALIADSVQAAASSAQAQSLVATFSTQALSSIPALASAQFQALQAPAIGQKTVAYSATVTRNGLTGTVYLIGFAEKEDVVAVATFGLPNTVSLANTASLAQVIDGRILATP